jgi:hypothetical protein
LMIADRFDREAVGVWKCIASNVALQKLKRGHSSVGDDFKAMQCSEKESRVNTCIQWEGANSRKLADGVRPYLHKLILEAGHL